jgi:hypothetical protein
MRRRRVVIGLAVLALLAGIAVTAAVRHDTRPPRDEYGHLYDPIEDDPAVRPLLAEADREGQARLEEMRAKQGRPGKGGLGDVHFYWALKKEYLKDKYGIDWRTPAEMNPNIAFD